jgi:hypothetical protein
MFHDTTGQVGHIGDYSIEDSSESTQVTQDFVH